MNPCELNAIITAIANYFFVSLSKEDFVLLNIIISELSKSMFTMALFRDICHWEDKDKHRHGHKDKDKDEDDDKHA